jgi:solute carrier family 25 protein 38
VTFSSIKGRFKQGRYRFEIKHNPDAAQENAHKKIINLADESGSTAEDKTFYYSADLKFPVGRQAVWELSFDIKDPGSLELEAIEMEIETDTYLIVYTVRPNHFQLPSVWYIPTEDGRWPKRTPRETPWIVDVKPKPPKVKLDILNIDEVIYTDEPVELTFEFTNEEEEAVSVAVDARLMSRGTAPELCWLATDEPDSTRALTLPTLAPGESSSQTALFTAPAAPGKLILEAKLHYVLPSDPQMPLTRTFSAPLAIASPFEANYSFQPRTHPAPWPSFFSVDDTVPAPGLLQRWALDVRMASFADAPLAVHAVAVAPMRVPPALASCVVVEDDGEQKASEMAPRTMRTVGFEVDTVRKPAKEHRAAALEARVTVTWSRVLAPSDSPSAKTPAAVTSTLAVPPLVVPPLEPRVVANAVHSRSGGEEGAPMTTLTLAMENPTAHPLTFDVAAPSSERLAFAGPKQAAVALLPYSRGEVVYRLVPLRGAGDEEEGEGERRAVFGVRVQDQYFVREVEVLAGEGLEAVEGGVGWVVE